LTPAEEALFERIAGALENIDRKLGELPIGEQIVEAFKAPLNAYGEGIAECIQGQLERSNRW
jgi:hypothetical protein